MKNKSYVGTGNRWKTKDAKCELSCPEDHPLVIAFSGGRTSGMMLRYYLDKETKPPIVLFANTGKERDETLDFVHEIETQWGCSVVWLQLLVCDVTKDRLQHIPSLQIRQNLSKRKQMLWFTQVTYETACRHSDNNSPFEQVVRFRNTMPNPVARYCSAELKVNTMQKYLWTEGIYTFRNAIGFRADEPDRAYELIFSKTRRRKVHLEFPLMNLGVTQEDVLNFWRNQSFDLQLESYEGNCHLCFLKKRKALIRLIAENPEMVSWWSNIEIEKKQQTNTPQGGQFNRNYSVADLIQEASTYVPNDEDVQNAMQCACSTSMSLDTET